MPVEEVKKKHKLFPFHIIRRRSKGKSKSLADLRGSDNEISKRNIRLAQQASFNQSFDTDDSEQDRVDGELRETPDDNSVHSDEEMQHRADMVVKETCSTHDITEEILTEEDSELHLPQLPEGTTVSFLIYKFSVILSALFI